MTWDDLGRPYHGETLDVDSQPVTPSRRCWRCDAPGASLQFGLCADCYGNFSEKAQSFGSHNVGARAREMAAEERRWRDEGKVVSRD